MPELAGVGFTDLGSGVPGTHSAAFKPAALAAWRSPFFDRLADQARRAGGGCAVCGAPAVVAFSGLRQFQELFPLPPRPGGPRAGQAQLKRLAAGSAVQRAGSPAGGVSSPGPALPLIRLVERRPASIAPGRQLVLPQDWPLDPSRTEVWVMPSTSGAAAMTREQRFGPWQALADRLSAIPQRPLMPRACTCPAAPPGA